MNWQRMAAQQNAAAKAEQRNDQIFSEFHYFDTDCPGKMMLPNVENLKNRKNILLEELDLS